MDQLQFTARSRERCNTCYDQEGKEASHKSDLTITSALTAHPVARSDGRRHVSTMLNEIDEYRGNAPRYSPDDLAKYRSGSDPWTHPNTDWYDDVIKPVAVQDIGTLTVSGGSEDVKYYVSLGTLSEDGVYRNSGTKYRQYNFRSNVDAKISDFYNVVDLSGVRNGENIRPVADNLPDVDPRKPNCQDTGRTFTRPILKW